MSEDRSFKIFQMNDFIAGDTYRAAQLHHHLVYCSDT